MANIKISELSPLLTVQDADVIPIVDNAITKKVTAEILRSYTQGNSVLLTGSQTVAGIKTFTAQIASSVATGTAPFSVASTTKVTNLNADLLDGLSSADFQATLSGTGIVKSTAGTISYLTDNTANWNTAFNDKINSAAVTGIGTNTLTLTQQDAGTITATWVNGTLIREIRNTTGATLTKGTIVYISGATGNKPTVSKAIATGDSTSAQTFGFVQENILNNANGNVVVIGDLTGVDTSAFAEGAQLYLSATTAGTFTDVKQYAPNHLVYVGIVTRAHPTLGQIEVNIQNGYELDELHNVAAQSPSNGDILQYVTSTGLWTKIGGTTSAISEGSNLYFTNARSRSAISLTTTGTSGAATYNSTTGVLNVPNYADTDTGITSLNGLTALTQTFAVGTSGTDFGISSATSTHTFNLPTASATNRGALSSADWTTFNNKQNALTNPITGTGTTNYLPKFTGASALGNSLIYDSGTAIGIGTTTPSQLLSIEGGASNAWARFTNTTNSGGLYVGTSTTGEAILYQAGNYNLSLFTNATERLTITSAGNVGIGTTGPSYKLSIQGSAGIEESEEYFYFNSSYSIGNNARAKIRAVGAGGGSGYGGDLRFSSRASNNVWNEDAMIINSSGNVITTSDATINGVKVGKGAGNVAGNTAVGASSLNANTTGDFNTSVGNISLASNTIGDGNAALGYGTLNANTTGNQNTAIGNSALLVNTTGTVNTAVGSAALYSNISGSNNVAIGRLALFSNTASGNTAVGFEAAYSNISGDYLAVLGYQALKSNTTGANNTAVGNLAANKNTTGSSNTAIGRSALENTTTATANTALGFAALYSNTTGSNNIGIGYFCETGNFNGSIIIGYEAFATASNQFVVGSAAVPAGAVATEVNASSKVWNVRINGVAQKILLA